MISITKPFLSFFIFSLLLIGGPAAQSAELPNFSDLAESQSHAVVNISTKKYRESETLPPQFRGLPDDWLRYFFNQPDRDWGGPQNPEGEQPELHSLGSGFVVGSDGYIVTNHHVINGADEIIVRFRDLKAVAAQVVGSDERTDLALLKVDMDNLPTVEFGESSHLKVGAWVIAIGSPFGFDYSVTAGIVSAKGRSLPSDSYVSFIQTDVAINPGNSGGPLFDLQGKVVGVNSQIYSRSGGFMGVSFAIPADLVKHVVNQLKTQGKVSRGYLGVHIQEITSELSETFNMESPFGALVAKVVDDSPASKGGIQVGDVITHFNGHKITRSHNLPPTVGITPVGSSAPVKIIRDDKHITLDVVIAELNEDSLENPEKPSSGTTFDRIGIVTIRLPEELEKELGQGVSIKEVIHGSSADRAGLEAGDVFLRLQGYEIENTADLKEIISGIPPQTRVRVLIYRQGRTLFSTMLIP